MAEPAARGDGQEAVPPPVRDTPAPGAVAALAAKSDKARGKSEGGSPVDSVSRIAGESRRYQNEVESRRPPMRTRSIRAYWTTFVVISSYLWLRFRARFHSEQWFEHELRRVNLRNARRIEEGICELQGLFIKVGQMISIMTNFLPEEFRKELEGLQDAVPPRPYKDIENRLRQELGRPPKEVFAQFEQRPIASASIGQVHIARLESGQKVAVKVQYPDVEEVVRRDLLTLRRIFKIVGWFVPYQGLEELYREIRAIVLEELDYRAEADNARKIGANFEGRTDVVFPTVVEELSTARVLVTHFEAGCKITDKRAVKAMGIDRATLARQVVEIYCQQIFTDGVYHADPHPGNILVREGAKEGVAQLVFLDFGAVAEIPGKVRQGIVDVLQGAITGDTGKIVASMKTMGFVARGANEAMFEQVVEYFHTKFQENISLDSLNLKDIKFDPQKSLESVADLRRMDISLRELSASFHVPKEIIVLERTLLLLMGLCTELDPTLNPMTVIRPYLERFVLGEEGDWSELLVDTSKDLVMSVAALPAEMRKFMRGAHNGDLQIKFKNIEAPTQLMYRLGHQLIFAGVGIACSVIAITLEGRNELERADISWWIARGSAVLLLWSWWTSRNLLRKK
ncbi:MAG TPA: AarF/UbiB family protein [Kofleriaceae bacterium]